MVVNWLTPPPICSTNSPPEIAPPSVNPFSTVRRPTWPLRENVSPGRTTVPSTRSAIRWMLTTRDWQHGCSVVKLATSSVIPSAWASAVVRSGSTVPPSSSAVRGPGEVATASTWAAAARASKANPSTAGTRRTCPPTTSKPASCGSLASPANCSAGSTDSSASGSMASSSSPIPPPLTAGTRTCSRRAMSSPVRETCTAPRRNVTGPLIARSASDSSAATCSGVVVGVVTVVGTSTTTSPDPSNAASARSRRPSTSMVSPGSGTTTVADPPLNTSCPVSGGRASSRAIRSTQAAKSSASKATTGATAMGENVARS